MQMSNAASRRTLCCMKGNHRRTFPSGMTEMWGYREYLYHSFARRGAITFDEIRM